jgi:Fe2+ or Zn2+ uptake regulation protein
MTVSNRIDAPVKELLDAPTQRVTSQRLTLLELIKQSGGHVDAGELHRRAQQKHPRISLSTIYRNLQLFKKMGLITEHHFVEEHHIYEVKEPVDHQHLQCIQCGRIIEIECPVSDTFRKKISKQYDFSINDVEVHMKGICSQCRKANM